VAADLDRIDAGDTLGAVGDVYRGIQVVHENAHDFAKAQRHDRQVIAAQAQRRRAEHDAEAAGDQRPQRQDGPYRPVQAEMRRCEQRIDVGADGIEGDVAEIEQAGKADHDVEAQRQHDIQQGEIENPQPGVAQSGADDKRQRDQGQRDEAQTEPRIALPARRHPRPLHARSATFSPSSPAGRNTSTPIRMKKANTS